MCRQFNSVLWLSVLAVAIGCDGQSVEGSAQGFGPVGGGGVKVKVGAADLRKMQWEDLEDTKDKWHAVIDNPGPYAEKHNTTAEKVVDYAQANYEMVMSMKAQMLPGGGGEPDALESRDVLLARIRAQQS